MNITKSELKDRLGFSTDVQIAELFGVTKQAVGRWGDDKPIPAEHALRLRYELRPDIFGPAPAQGEAA